MINPRWQSILNLRLKKKKKILRLTLLTSVNNKGNRIKTRLTSFLFFFSTFPPTYLPTFPSSSPLSRSPSFLLPFPLLLHYPSLFHVHKILKQNAPLAISTT